LTCRSGSDLTLVVQSATAKELSIEQRREVAAWIEKNSARLPESVRIFLALHQKYLAAGADLRRPFETAWRELRRALGITPSSERRKSGNPLSSIPPNKAGDAKSGRAWLEQQHERSIRLSDWHKGLKRRHQTRAKRLGRKLAKMPAERTMEHASRLDVRGQEITENTPVEDIELTEEEKAESAASAQVFVEHLELGDGADQSLQSVNETLMPGGAVLANVEQESLSVEVPEELARAKVVKELHEKRVRYDFSVTVTRIELDVEKKVIEKDGERYVVAASTRDIGPPRYAVTWSALATLAVMVGQFALPYHRLATMLSTTTKRFTAGSLSRMLRYVAERLVPIYLELATQLANSEILAGDDTSCRVLEVASYLAEPQAGEGASEKKKPPWAEYQTPKAAEESLCRCEAAHKARMRRREDGDREAKRTPDETASLGVLIGRKLAFESPRRDGNGPKASMNTTVVSGRSVADDPRSLIVFYRSHLGGCGNLLESILKHRDRKARDIVLQADLSTTNLVTSPELLGRFKFNLIGCSAHARRPFANYEHEDPVNCSYMLHLFCGLAIHEQRLDVHGRNRENVLAVRQAESRELWDDIKMLAQTMTSKWSPATKLGAGARYIVKHFEKLTAYLEDPRLEPTNNLRERMLRMEKLIEGSSMFRQSLEGRFVLDIVRTVLQTAVAAGVPVHTYVETVLRADAEEIAKHPERFTPHAWAAANASVRPEVVAQG
jgi:hypothetical protein